MQGVNGSGKTSLLKTIAGVLPLKSGSILLNGARLHATSVHWIGTEPCMKPSLTAWENLNLWATVEHASSFQTISALRTFHLEKEAQTPYKLLSKGQQQRCSLARLLLAHKPLWLLDEPDVYLDQEGKSLLVEQIEAHRQTGGIVILASHQGLPLKNCHHLDTRAYAPLGEERLS